MKVLLIVASVMVSVAFVASVVTAFQQPSGSNFEIAVLWFLVFIGDVNYLILREKVNQQVLTNK